MSITQILLEFLMNLLRNPEAASHFLDDPQGALDEAGLSGISTDDVDAVMPVVMDYAPVASVGDREYNTGGSSASGGGSGHPGSGGWAGSPGGSGGTSAASPGGSGGTSAVADSVAPPAVVQLTHVVNNFSYTSVDDRDTTTDQSVNQNVWALGDVTQWFDNVANVASGDGSAAGHASADNSTDNSTTFTAGGDLNIGNTALDVGIADSFQDNSNNSDNSDNSTDNSVNLTDSLNGSLNDNSDNSTDDSVNLTDSLNGSLNDNSDNSATDNSDNSVTDNSDNS